MKKIWDLERLIGDADSFNIAASIGMETRRFGAVTYVRCPAGTHPETRINHAKLFRNGCKCFSCGQSYSSYGMVKAYMENILGNNISHDEICTILADSTGAGESEYLIRGSEKTKGKRFPLSKEELELIGLSPKPAPRVIKSYRDCKDELHQETCGDGYAMTAAASGISIFSLYREDEEMFWELVQDKSKEAYKAATAWMVDTILDLPLAEIKKHQNGLLGSGIKRYADLRKLCRTLDARRKASSYRGAYRKAS